MAEWKQLMLVPVAVGLLFGPLWVMDHFGAALTELEVVPLILVSIFGFVLALGLGRS